MGPLLCLLSETQASELRDWATDGLVRLWESGGVSFDFLVETQRRLGVGDGSN